MSDMHSQHLGALASKWQQYQTLGQKLNADHHESLEKMAQMQQRYSVQNTVMCKYVTVLLLHMSRRRQQLHADGVVPWHH